MKLPIKIFLTLSLWISLPIVLLIYFRLATATPLAKSAILFALYTGFSWPIALLAFIMESARQRLFRPPLAHRTAIRLGLYGLFAIVLAMLTSPWFAESMGREIFQAASVGFIYCYTAGLFYWFVCINPDRQSS